MLIVSTVNFTTSHGVLEDDFTLEVLGRPPGGGDARLALLVDVRDGIVDALPARHVVGILALERANLQNSKWTIKSS